ncbi:uncharacterized protein LOC106160426 [Lingula anatina]|uniref:Uncharacterized protein LOC106160426 n=1 Tax=Lingula anatina TaxID=7574 RepID=A0A1S3I3S6_LINAN|nr:uncharacterized protein LOC106160426 [Lingula anatina]|eukprot:XP_013392486.1 uncharacterized protein LOC106160426 [Lingula anatina]
MASAASNGTNNSNILLKNCRADWPDGLCIIFNLCGLASTCIWFIVLFPQVWKNFRRKSVVGLSVLWATANFTASLINLFFVFYIGRLPLYSKVEAIYMPVMEFTLLIQFFAYGTQRWRSKLVYCLVCVLLWGGLITTEVVTDWYMDIQWGAIVLWSIESFPQVMLNMKLGSTSGQSTASVTLAVIGKICDFLSTYGLVMPLQYVIMSYFSSTLGCFNGVQVAWYKKKKTNGKYSNCNAAQDDAETFCEERQNNAVIDHIQDKQSWNDKNNGIRERGHRDVPDTPSADISGSQFEETPSVDFEEEHTDNIMADDELLPETIPLQHHGRCLPSGCPRLSESRIQRVKQFLRWPTLIFLTGILLFYAAGLVWNTHSYFSLFAPIGTTLLLSLYWLYTHKKIMPHFQSNQPELQAPLITGDRII